jgi:hypothetical protein
MAYLSGRLGKGKWRFAGKQRQVLLRFKPQQ